RERIWSIPWLAGTRLLYFRKDLLAQAGIDPQAAFSDHYQLFDTLEKLQAAGPAAPWVVPTQLSLNTIHYISSWVWGAGGHYLSPDGKNILLNTEETYSGLMDYYSLAPFLPQPAQGLTDDTVERLFWQDGQVAVTIGGHWLMRSFREVCPSEIYDQLGVVPVPGVPFVGGSNLVIWEHTRQRPEALQLVQFLASERVQLAYGQAVGLLPTRLSALAQPPFSTDPVYAAAGREINKGRGFSSIPMWNVFERRLTDAYARIWSAVLESPGEDLMTLISRELDPLARRLDIMLRSRG
ncbi:MAG: extracellular solute-binding protein, partial [Anaerolineales bacterium]|nr:extracellular solute-binding protein [Anaerolineales bacterium]